MKAWGKVVLAVIAAIAVFAIAGFAVAAVNLRGDGQREDSGRVAEGNVRLSLTPERPASRSQLAGAAETMTARLQSLGIPGEAEVAGNAVHVEVPATSAEPRLFDVLLATGEMEVRPVLEVLFEGVPTPLDDVAPDEEVVLAQPDGDETLYRLGPAVLTNDEVQGASVEAQGTSYGVHVVLTDAGGAQWHDFTSANVGTQVAVVIDGEVALAPVIHEPIRDFVLWSDDSEAFNQDLAAILDSGPLPVPFEAHVRTFRSTRP